PKGDLYAWPLDKDTLKQLVDVFRLMVDKAKGGNGKVVREIAWVRLPEHGHALVHCDEVNATQDVLPRGTQELLAHTHPSSNVNLSQSDRNTLTKLNQTRTWVVASAATPPGAVLWNVEAGIEARVYF